MAVKRTKRTSTQKSLSPKKKAYKSPARSNKEGIAATAYDLAKAGSTSNPLSIIRMINGIRTPISVGGGSRSGNTKTTKRTSTRRTKTIKSPARSYRGR